MVKFPNPPTLWDASGRPVDLINRYYGDSAFLICSGPSLNTLDLSLLEKPGIIKMGVNNSPSIVRPDFWTHVDSPDRFLKSIWFDPKITKFVPSTHKEKPLWDNTTKKPLESKPKNCSNTFFYKMKSGFNPEAWVTEEVFNWGNADKQEFVFEGVTHRGGRSCMLPAMKLLIIMGFRKIYLVGADFNMDISQPYAFSQEKSKGGCKGNNNTYKTLNAYFRSLKPYLKQLGVSVYNTNSESGLTVFDHKPYTEAIAEATSKMGDLSKETTEDHYLNYSEKKKKYGKSKPVSNEKNVNKKPFKTKEDIKPPRNFEGYWNGERIVTEEELKTTSLALTATELLEYEEQLTEINPIFASVCKAARRKKEIFEEQKNVTKGVNLNAMLKPLLDYFVQEFVKKPRRYKSLAIIQPERTIEVNNETRLIGDFL